MQRRKFLLNTSKASLALGLFGMAACSTSENTKDKTMGDEAMGDKTMDDKSAMMETWFDISLAQWSLNKALFAGDLDNLDFAKITRETFGLGGIEYVSQFFKEQASDMDYLKQMKQRANDHGVRSLLIMIDGEGNLGDTDDKARMQAVENHHRWVDAAKFLGCHSIRVNAAGQGTREEVSKNATEGLAKLSEYAKTAGLNVIVENHGGYSSDGSWLANVIKNTGMDNCGTLPDFGNFCIERTDPSNWEAGCKTEYDRYKGVTELMPYAKAVSAKSYDFNAEGEVVETDYSRMMSIVKDAGYTGWVGIEYEGNEMGAEEGIQKTIDILKKNGGRVG